MRPRLIPWASGNYTVTVTWNDGSANSYTLASFPWCSSIAAASGSLKGRARMEIL